MNRKVALALVAVTLVAGACGGKSNPAASNGGSNVVKKSPTEWAGAFCAAASGLSTSLTSMSTSFQSAIAQSSDLNAAKAILVNFLDSATKSAEALRDSVQALGPLDIKDGKAIFEVIHEGTKKAVKVFADARDTARGLATDNAEAFGAAMTNLGTQLENGGKEIEDFFAQLDTKFKGSEAETAFNSVDACKSL